MLKTWSPTSNFCLILRWHILNIHQNPTCCHSITKSSKHISFTQYGTKKCCKPHLKKLDKSTKLRQSMQAPRSNTKNEIRAQHTLLFAHRSCLKTTAYSGNSQKILILWWSMVGATDDPSCAGQQSTTSNVWNKSYAGHKHTVYWLEQRETSTAAKQQTPNRQMDRSSYFKTCTDNARFSK